MRGLKHDESTESGRRERRDGWTLAKQRCFIETLAESGVVAWACDNARMSRQSAYYFRQSENGRAFAALWDEARQIAGRGLIDDMISVAVNGDTVALRDADGVVLAASRRKSPLRLVSMIEKIRAPEMLGTPRAMAASRNFATCLDMLEEGQLYADRKNKPLRIPRMLSPEKLDLDNPKPAVYYRRWTPERQRTFCEVLSQGGTIEQACSHAGRQRSGAYNLRNRAEGQAFALAWDAALLVYSNEMMDTAFQMAREGVDDEFARKDQSSRWRRTTRPDLAMQVVTRLNALKAREDALYGDGYARIGCAHDFGAALDRLESGEALRNLQALDRGKTRRQ